MLFALQQKVKCGWDRESDKETNESSEEGDDLAEVLYEKSNSEGELVSQIQRAGFEADFIILNGAGYTHTSVAMADAIALIPAPVVEVHISNIYAREEFRQHSLTAHNCVGVITGLGLEGYSLAIDYCLRSDKR